MTAPAPEATPEAPETGAPEAPAAPEQKDGPSPEDQLAHWKEQARKQEARAKANSAAAKELEEIKKSQMSAEEKAAAAAKERDAENERLRSENIRFKAAAVHGISEDNFDLLGTGTEDEILVRAERLGEMEDAVNEVGSLRAENAQLKQQLAALMSGDPTAQILPQPVTTLAPGTPPVKDDSYPPGWFPSLAPNPHS